MKKLSEKLFKSSTEETLDLIKKGININIKDDKGNNALFYANVNKSFVLLKNGIDVNNKNNDGETAIFYSDFKKTDLLLNFGADVNVVNKKGFTPLFYSDTLKSELLIENNADFNYHKKMFKDHFITLLDYEVYKKEKNEEKIKILILLDALVSEETTKDEYFKSLIKEVEFDLFNIKNNLENA